MADPFSLFAASAGLVDVLWRCGSYIKKVLESAATIDKDILSLSHATDTLISVNESLQETCKAERCRGIGTSLEERDRVESLWQNVGTLLEDCRKTVEELETMLLEVIGKGSIATSRLGNRLGGKLDDLKKTIRMDDKDNGFKKMHLRMVNYQNSLQVLLVALTL